MTGDTDDIRKEYEILLNELATFNPEMLDKQRVLAITKSDMLDEELIAMLEPTLPDNVPHIFISSVTGLGIQQLKDILWTELNKDSNKLEGVRTETIVHRAKDVAKLRTGFLYFFRYFYFHIYFYTALFQRAYSSDT